MAQKPQLTQFRTLTPSPPGLILLATVIEGLVGFFSAAIPSRCASRMNIVEGLRYIG